MPVFLLKSANTRAIVFYIHSVRLDKIKEGSMASKTSRLMFSFLALLVLLALVTTGAIPGQAESPDEWLDGKPIGRAAGRSGITNQTNTSIQSQNSNLNQNPVFLPVVGASKGIYG